MLDLSSSSPYKSPSEYIDKPSFELHNIPVIEGVNPITGRVSIDSLPSTSKGYKCIPNPNPTTHEPVTANTSSASASSSSSYEPTASLVREAHEQYAIGRGIFWSLAVLKLCPHFLHPVDLTASEFATLVTVDDADAWLESHRAKLVHRAITRRADAQRALNDAGVPYRQLQGIELFELMDEPARAAFIAEFQRRQKRMLEELRDAAERDIVPPGMFAAAESGVYDDDRDADDKEILELESLERRRNIETGLSTGSSEEQHNRTATASLRRHRSVFGSLGWMFNKHDHIHAHAPARKEPSESSSSTALYTDQQGVRGWKLSRRLSKSHSFRHIFERKSRALKRHGIDEGVFVE